MVVKHGVGLAHAVLILDPIEELVDVDPADLDKRTIGPMGIDVNVAGDAGSRARIAAGP